MQAWKRAWRDGFAPQLSIKALEALRRALVADDQRLMQGATTSPPPLQCVADWPVEGACAIGLCGWLGESLETVAEVEEFFATLCFNCDQRLGEPAGCRHFLNAMDDMPRPEMISELLAEVEIALEARRLLESQYQ